MLSLYLMILSLVSMILMVDPDQLKMILLSMPLKDSELSNTSFKIWLTGLLTKFLAKFQICWKLCLCVEKDYTNKFSKFQVPKLCGSWDIHIKKSVVFGRMICYFYSTLQTFYLASDAVVFSFWLASHSLSL